MATAEAWLWLLAESDLDEAFFEGCAQAITGRSFRAQSRRLRKGSGIGAVRASLTLMLNAILRTGALDDTFFIAAMDNDRAPQHPTGVRPPGPLSRFDRNKQNRHRELLGAAEAILGPDRSQWPIPGAIAVPVEMIETWALLISDPLQHQDRLPIFAAADSASAKDYHGGTPAPQLKDLVEQLCAARGMSKADLFLDHACSAFDADDLAERAPSFALFLADLRAWPPPA